MKRLKVLLVGQPNVGKSSLLNALVGPKIVVSNYPGTTVEITKAEMVVGERKIIFEDTPGIYSITDKSEEETVTEKALFEKKGDSVLIVADSTSLERSLYLALQVMEAQMPVVIALNFVEDADKRGVKINYKILEKLLNVPIIRINPITKRGINELVDVLLEDKREKDKFCYAYTVRYDTKIEEAINKVMPHLSKTPLPKRFVALRILEEDIHFYKYLKNRRILEELKNKYKNIAKNISVARYETGRFISKTSTKETHLEKGRKYPQEGIDKFFLHKTWGPVLTFAFFCITFGILLFLGSFIQEFLMDLTDGVLASLSAVQDSLTSIIINNAVLGLMGGISIALPYVFLFYLILGIIEDMGLLPRFVVNLERFFKEFNLPGKSLIPLSLGFGCTVPAIRATRILASKRERYCTASLFTCVPCSSRLAIIMGIVGHYGGVSLAFAVIVTLVVSALIWAFIMKKIVPIKYTPLIFELPPYRKPLFKNVLIKSWIRMKDFVYIVIPLLAVGGAIYGALNITGVDMVVVGPLVPITKWLGLPDLAIIPIVFGFLQKDLTGAMLLSVFGTGIASALSPLQIYTFGVATTIQIPCIIALAMLVKEFGYKKAAILTGLSMVYGLLIAGLAWRLISIFPYL